MEKGGDGQSMKKNTKLSTLHNWQTGRYFLQAGLLLSRSQIKKANLSKAFLGRKIDKGTTVNVPLNLINKKEISPFYLKNSMEIIFEDSNLLALSKIPDVHSHPLSYDEHDNCLSFLRSIDRGDLLHVNDDFYDRGLLYRLDYETSGVLVYIKKQGLLQYLRNNFHQVVKEKKYMALVCGKHSLQGVYTHNLIPAGRRKHIMKTTPGNQAVMEIKRSRYLETFDLTLLKILLVTGFRHQIRTQLSALGVPVLGDVLYGGKKADRLFLHASCYRLAWEDHLYNIECLKASLFEHYCHF